MHRNDIDSELPLKVLDIQYVSNKKDREVNACISAQEMTLDRTTYYAGSSLSQMVGTAQDTRTMTLQ